MVLSYKIDLSLLMKAAINYESLIGYIIEPCLRSRSNRENALAVHVQAVRHIQVQAMHYRLWTLHGCITGVLHFGGKIDYCFSKEDTKLKQRSEDCPGNAKADTMTLIILQK